MYFPVIPSIALLLNIFTAYILFDKWEYTTITDGNLTGGKTVAYFDLATQLLKYLYLYK